MILTTSKDCIFLNKNSQNFLFLTLKNTLIYVYLCVYMMKWSYGFLGFDFWLEGYSVRLWYMITHWDSRCCERSWKSATFSGFFWKVTVISCSRNQRCLLATVKYLLQRIMVILVKIVVYQNFNTCGIQYIC